MKKKLDEKTLNRFSRQVIIKNIGIIGQQKILNSSVFVVGAGGLGCSIID